MIGVMLRMFHRSVGCSARLLTMDNSIHSAIREYHPKYPVTAHTYPAFVYLRGQYDPMNPSKGLFKGELLVRVRHYGYCAPILCSDSPCIGILLHLHITKLSLS